MTNKVELNELTQVVHKEQAFLVALNENFYRLQAALNDTLSRTGVTPNQMEEVLDMNGKRIINTGTAEGDNDVITKAYIADVIAEVEAAIRRADELIDQAIAAVTLYASENIYPVLQNAVDAAVDAKDSAKDYADAAKDYYDDTKALYDALEDLDRSLDELLTVYANLADITTVANNISDVSTVAGVASGVSTVAEIASDVTECATNMSDIQAAPTAASNAATSASNAQTWAEGSDADVSALGGTHSAKGWANYTEGALSDCISNEEVSNRIATIPQDINLSLSSGTITLEAGSITYIPDGSDNFEKLTLQTQKTYSYAGSDPDGDFLILYSRAIYALVSRPVGKCFSGSTAPTGTGTIYWYDTQNNVILRSSNGGSTWGTEKLTLPLALVSIESGTISEIKQVFNGFGYIGSLNFVLPGVSGFYPDGRNSDGSPKSGFVKVENVLTSSGTTDGLYHIMINNSDIGNFFSNVYYDKVKNIFWNSGNPKISRLYVGDFKRSGGFDTDMETFDVLGVVKYDDLDTAINGVNATIGTLSNLTTSDKTNIVSAINEVNANTSKNITNCVTAISQDLTFELSGGTLTLKSGSTLYRPNGSGVFDEITTTSDVTSQSSTFTNGRNVVFDNGNHSGTSLRLTPFSKCFSGSTAPESPASSDCWYDTANNIVKVYSGGVWQYQRTLPLAVVNVESGVITSIEKVFNGFGYIGTTIFVLPGVSGLAPDGRNSDGTLKNAVITTSSVLVTTETSNGTFHMMLAANDFSNFVNVYYDEDRNILWNSDNPQILRVDCGTISCADGYITEFNPKKIISIPTIDIQLPSIPGHVVTCSQSGYSLGWSPQGTISNNNKKTVGIFGGSFAATANAGPSITEFENRLGVSCTDYALSGAGFVRGANNFVVQATGADAKDIYIIWCSTNDFTGDIPIGDKDDVYGTDTTVWANFKEMIRILYTKNPNAKICLFTSSPHLKSSQGNEEGFGTVTTYLNTLKEHVDAQKEMCAYYSLPCLDQYTRSNQNSNNYSLVCKNDDFHLTAFGYQMLLNNQLDFLLSV